MLPEFFTMLSTDMFVMLSLLTCLLEERFPKPLPYIYQIAALVGFGHLLVSREFLGIFDIDMRFWSSIFYLGIALANVIAINIYFAFSQQMWMLAKTWSATVTFPMIFVSTFFIYYYGGLETLSSGPLMLQSVLVLSVAVVGIAVGILLSPNLLKKLTKR